MQLSISKKVAASAAGLALAFSAVFAGTVHAQTAEELQAQIQNLLSMIATLQAQLAAGGSSTTTGGACTAMQFTLNEKQGSTGAEVMNVQKFLNINGFTVATSGAGSAGNETSYFGPATKAAVIKFQNAYASEVLAPVGLSAGTGYWGASSRAKANAMEMARCSGTGSTTGGTVTPNGAGLTVSAAAQPGNSLAPSGAARVPFTKFTVTNGSNVAQTINSVVVERTSLASDSNFTGVVLLDQDGSQVGNAQTLNSIHQATIGAPITLNPGESRTFTVAANMQAYGSSSIKAGEVASFSVVAINSAAAVTGALPITGAQHTINATLQIGSFSSVTVSSFDPNGAQSKNIGDTGVRFAGLRFTAGSTENVVFQGLRFRLNGSVSASDLGNVVINVNGTDYPAVLSSDGRYFSVMIPSGVRVEKGFSVDVYAKGDIVGTNASGRVAEFDVDKTSDVYAVGETYGYGIQPAAGSSSVSTASTHGSAITSGQPWFQGSTISISGASVTTIAKASEVPAANVAVNVPNVVLGGFVTDIKGEPLNVQTLKFDVAYSVARSSTTTDVLTNVTLVDENGAVVAGPSDEVGSSVTAGAVTLSSSVTFPVGRHVYTLKGKIDPDVSSGTVTMSTTPSSSSYWTNVTGQATGNTITLTTGAFSMNPMTIKAASLAASVASTPVAQTIVAGSQDVTLATFQFDASNSGEDVRFSNVPVAFNGSTSDMSSCRVFDGSTNLTSGANVISTPSSTGNFVFDNSIVVTKGTIKSLDVKCNISGSATDGDTLSVGMGTVTSNGISATGVTSNNAVGVTGGSANAATMTIGAGSVAVSTDASSPSLTLKPGGAQEVTLGVWKMRATNDQARVEKIGLALATSTASTSDVMNVTVWQGSTQVAGPVTFTSSTGLQAVTLTTPVVLAKDTDVVFTIRGNLANIGSAQPGHSGNTVAVNWDSTAANNQITGVGSGTAITATGSTSVAGVRTYKSVATITDDSATLGATGVADGKLARFKVTADAAGSLGVAQVAFSTSYSAATVSNAMLYAYTDAGYSTPVSSSGSSDGQVGSTQSTVASSTTYKFNSAANPVQVGAGQTVYFELRASVVPTTGASVVTTILGDATAITPAAYSSASSSDFVWSPNTNGTTASTTADWVNGANVTGLPSAGFSKARGL